MTRNTDSLLLGAAERLGPTEPLAHLIVCGLIVVVEHLQQHLQPVKLDVLVAVVLLSGGLIMVSVVLLPPVLGVGVGVHLAAVTVVVLLVVVVVVVVVVRLASAMRVEVLSFAVGDVVQEVLRLLQPPALLHGLADQPGRREVQDAPGSQSRELGHAEGLVHRTHQLLDGAAEVTLSRSRGETSAL